MTAELTLTPSVRVKLSLMMFLQFFVWGAYFVTMGTYLLQGLHFTGTETALAYSTMPWGAIVAPFVIGMIADRFFAAEKLLGVLHLRGRAAFFIGSRPSRHRGPSSGCCCSTRSATTRRSRW